MNYFTVEDGNYDEVDKSHTFSDREIYLHPPLNPHLKNKSVPITAKHEFGTHLGIPRDVEQTSHYKRQYANDSIVQLPKLTRSPTSLQKSEKDHIADQQIMAEVYGKGLKLQRINNKSRMSSTPKQPSISATSSKVFTREDEELFSQVKESKNNVQHYN